MLFLIIVIPDMAFHSLVHFFSARQLEQTEHSEWHFGVSSFYTGVPDLFSVTIQDFSSIMNPRYGEQVASVLEHNANAVQMVFIQALSKTSHNAPDESQAIFDQKTCNVFKYARVKQYPAFDNYVLSYHIEESAPSLSFASGHTVTYSPDTMWTHRRSIHVMSSKMQN